MKSFTLAALAGAITTASAVDTARSAVHPWSTQVKRGECQDLDPCKYAPRGALVPDPKTIFLPNKANQLTNQFSLCKNNAQCQDFEAFSQFELTFKEEAFVFDFQYIEGCAFEKLEITLQKESPPQAYSPKFSIESGNCNLNQEGGLSCKIPYQSVDCSGYQGLCPTWMGQNGGLIFYAKVKAVVNDNGQNVDLFSQSVIKEDCWFSFSYCCTKCPRCPEFQTSQQQIHTPLPPPQYPTPTPQQYLPPPPPPQYHVPGPQQQVPPPPPHQQQCPHKCPQPCPHVPPPPPPAPAPQPPHQCNKGCPQKCPYALPPPPPPPAPQPQHQCNQGCPENCPHKRSFHECNNGCPAPCPYQAPPPPPTQHLPPPPQHSHECNNGCPKPCPQGPPPPPPPPQPSHECNNGCPKPCPQGPPPPPPPQPSHECNNGCPKPCPQGPPPPPPPPPQPSHECNNGCPKPCPHDPPSPPQHPHYRREFEGWTSSSTQSTVTVTRPWGESTTTESTVTVTRNPWVTTTTVWASTTETTTTTLETCKSKKHSTSTWSTTSTKPTTSTWSTTSTKPTTSTWSTTSAKPTTSTWSTTSTKPTTSTWSTTSTKPATSTWSTTSTKPTTSTWSTTSAKPTTSTWSTTSTKPTTSTWSTTSTKPTTTSWSTTSSWSTSSSTKWSTTTKCPTSTSSSPATGSAKPTRCPVTGKKLEQICESAHVVIYGQGEGSHPLKELSAYPGYSECAKSEGHFQKYVKGDLDVTVGGAIALNHDTVGGFLIRFDREGDNAFIAIDLVVNDADYYVTDAAVFIDCESGFRHGQGSHGGHICKPETFPYHYGNEQGIGDYEFRIFDDFKCKGNYVFAIWVKVCVADEPNNCQVVKVPVKDN